MKTLSHKLCTCRFFSGTATQYTVLPPECRVCDGWPSKFWIRCTRCRQMHYAWFGGYGWMVYLNEEPPLPYCWGCWLEMAPLPPAPMLTPPPKGLYLNEEIVSID